MKIFDLHADIGYDLYQKHLSQLKNTLIQDHYPKLIKGEIRALAMASFFYGHEDLDTALAMVRHLKASLIEHSTYFHRVLKGDFTDSKINVLMSLEGLGFLKSDRLDIVDEMVDLGIRLASLTWNDQNACATGISGDVSRGLTSFGEAVLQRFNDLNVVMDVSHLNEKSFWDVLRLTKKPVIASHSNTKHHCLVERNLTDQQIRVLIAQKGLIGLNAAKNFVDVKSNQQSANRLADHACHILALGGEDVCAIGFDYMDFLVEEASQTKMAADLLDASMSQNLIEALDRKGLKQSTIEKIAFSNAQNFFSQFK